MLEDIAQAIADIYREMNDLRRCANNIIIPGKVVAIDESGQKVIVKHGSCKTPPIKWIASSCGTNVSAYRAPEKGEQCVLLNLTGGKDTSTAVALMGIAQKDMPLPAEDVNQLMLNLKIGALLVDLKEQFIQAIFPDAKFNAQTNEITIKAPKVMIDTELLYVTGDIKSASDVIDKKCSMREMRDVHNAHDHKASKPRTSPPTSKM